MWCVGVWCVGVTWCSVWVFLSGQSLVCSFVCLFVRACVRSFVRLSVCLSVRSFVRFFVIYSGVFYSKILIGVSNILQELPEFYSIKLLLETIVDKLAYTAVLELVPLMQIPGVKKVYIHFCRRQYSLFWQFICLQALIKILN